MSGGIWLPQCHDNRMGSKRILSTAKIIWQCYDIGLFSLELAVDLSAIADIEKLRAVDGALIENLCHDVYEELGKHIDE
ncbi:MAG: hypothetical protein V7782_04300 [Psychromonas sp.]